MAKIIGFEYEDGVKTAVYVESAEGKQRFVAERHGQWEEHDGYPDWYYHHRCTNCKNYAPFDYKYREDWDEGMDGEWYPMGIVEDGINEHLTLRCPNCGAIMDGECE